MAEIDNIPSVPANSVQFGGSHYKSLAIEPWDYITANGIGYLEGNVIKYVTRWRQKAGVGDLRKARHYLDKLLELETCKNSSEILSSIAMHGMGDDD